MRFALLLTLPLAVTIAACTPQPAADEAGQTDEVAATDGTDAAATMSDAAPAEPAQASAPQADDDTDLCGASKVQSFVGQDSTVPIRTEVARTAGSATDRWIYPDSVITMDRRMDRLTVTMEKGTDKIVSIACG